MNRSEFDKFADEYEATLRDSIGQFGERPDYFADYKVRDIAKFVSRERMTVRSVLDFGCGTGGSIPHLKRLLANAELTGVDVSEKSLKIASERFAAAATYRLFDGQVLPFTDNCFDLVFTACVFHHIPEAAHISLLSEIRRVLTPGGAFIIYEHNPHNPLTVRVVNSCPFDKHAVLISAKKMRERLVAAGFDSIESNYRVFFPHFLSAFRRLEYALTWCPLGAQYYLSAKK